MDKVIFEISFYTSVVSAGVVAYFLMKIYRRQPPVYRWLAFSYLLSILCDFIMEFGDRTHLINQNIGSILYGIFLLPLVSVFFFKLLNRPAIRGPLIIIVIVYMIFAVCNYLFIQAGSINSYSQVFRTIVILSLTLMAFYVFMKDTPSSNLLGYPMFWICTGFLIASAGKLTLYGVTAYLIEIKESLYWPWTLHNTLSVVQHVFVGIGVWLRFKEVRPGDQVYLHNS